MEKIAVHPHQCVYCIIMFNLNTDKQLSCVHVHCILCLVLKRLLRISMLEVVPQPIKWKGSNEHELSANCGFLIL